MKKIIFLFILSLVVSGCFHARIRRETPDVPQVPLPSSEENAQQTFDENDYLDSALEELDAVE